MNSDFFSSNKTILFIFDCWFVSEKFGVCPKNGGYARLGHLLVRTPMLGSSLHPPQGVNTPNFRTIPPLASSPANPRPNSSEGVLTR